MKKKKCKNCKKDFTPKQLNGINVSKYCNNCRRKRETLKKKAQIEKAKLRKKIKKENNIPRLKKELDRVFSLYIRQRDADKDGFVVCPCCGTRIEWKSSQNMHYVGRANMNTRYDEDNCWAGCMSCNVFKNGNYPAYTNFLLNRFGEKWLKDLIRKGTKSRKFTSQELKDLIQYYKKALK